MIGDRNSGGFVLGGFECSTHRRRDGVRLDLIDGTAHDANALADYQSCAAHGLRSLRDGLRWHLIEAEPDRYDWSSWTPMLEAAAEAGVRVIWDILHYGYPDHRGIADPNFVAAYARFAASAVRLHRTITGVAAFVCPINEISYFTWAVRTGYFPPAGPPEHGWLKRRLVAAAIAGVRAMREADADCRFAWAEPLIHIAPQRGKEFQTPAAEEKRLGQYEAYDMLTGRSAPELGGAPDMIDVMGFNYYPDNQWFYEGSTIPLGHHAYRPLADMLTEAHERYKKPIFISETGAEGSGRAAWLHYVCDEARETMRRGVPVRGICLYPIAAYPGWDDGRHAPVGLFTTVGPDGAREVYQPLAAELARQQRLFAGRAS